MYNYYIISKLFILQTFTVNNQISGWNFSWNIFMLNEMERKNFNVNLSKCDVDQIIKISYFM